jgi:hypothetical protein
LPGFDSGVPHPCQNEPARVVLGGDSRVAGTICGLDSDRYQRRPKKPDIACRFTAGARARPAHRIELGTSVPDRSGSSRRATRLNADHSPDHNNPRQAALFSDPQEPARPGKPRYATTCSYFASTGSRCHPAEYVQTQGRGHRSGQGVLLALGSLPGEQVPGTCREDGDGRGPTLRSVGFPSGHTVSPSNRQEE